MPIALLQTIVSANLHNTTKKLSNYFSLVKTSIRMPEKTAICLLAEGAEEMEAVVTVDILRRAGVRFLNNI